MSDTTAYDTFYQPCRTCGTTVHVVAGAERPHEHVEHATIVPAALTYAYWQGHDAADKAAEDAIERIREASQPLRCGESWMEGDDAVCELHDYLWLPGRAFCNGVTADIAYLLETIDESRQVLPSGNPEADGPRDGAA